MCPEKQYKTQRNSEKRTAPKNRKNRPFKSNISISAASTSGLNLSLCPASKACRPILQGWKFFSSVLVVRLRTVSVFCPAIPATLPYWLRRPPGWWLYLCHPAAIIAAMMTAAMYAHVGVARLPGCGRGLRSELQVRHIRRLGLLLFWSCLECLNGCCRFGL